MYEEEIHVEIVGNSNNISISKLNREIIVNGGIETLAIIQI